MIAIRMDPEVLDWVPNQSLINDILAESMKQAS
jgi:hypothetical protein